MSDDLNVELTPEEQEQVAAANPPPTPDPAAAAPAAANNDALMEQVSKATEAATRAAEAANELRQHQLAREQQAAAEAAAAAAAEAEKEPDWAAQQAELKEKLESGEITDDEYERERERIYDAKGDWKAEQAARKATTELLDRRQQEEADRAWNTATAAFTADPANAAMLADPIRAAAFNAAVQLEAAKGFTSYADLLTRARDSLGVLGGVIQPANGADAIEKAKRERAAAAGGNAPHLHRAPAAGEAIDRDNRFAHLDALDIDDLENAVSRMSEADLDAFLETAPGGLRDNPRAG